MTKNQKELLNLFKKICKENHDNFKPFDVQIIKDKSVIKAPGFSGKSSIPIDAVLLESKDDLYKKYGAEDTENFLGSLSVLFQVYFYKLAFNGKMFCTKAEIKKNFDFVLDTENFLGITKDDQPSYNIAMAYFSLKTFVFTKKIDDERNFGLAILDEFEILYSARFFPYSGGRGFPTSLRKMEVRNDLRQYSYFSENDIDNIFEQLPVYKNSTNSTNSSGCLIPIIIILSSLMSYIYFSFAFLFL